MAHAPISLGGGGGSGSDDCTATLDYVLEGKTAITKDSDDEPGAGRMKVNSLLSFSVAAYSGRRLLAKWQNPKAAKGRPYSGIIIRYSTSGYPDLTGGTQIYKGAGNNTASEGESSTYLDMPDLNTQYYFTAVPYVTTSLGEMYGSPVNVTATTSGVLLKNITAGGTYTIPAGYTKADIFCVGGGGGGSGGSASSYFGTGGGGGGYTKTVKNIAVESGQVLAVSVGAGGYGGGNARGGTSSVSRDGVSLVSALGGYSPGITTTGGNGGSGGGNGGGDNTSPGQNGYSNGQPSGRGQGTTTRAFGESSGTLYAGGGGGGAGGSSTGYGLGGAGGGGNGGYYGGSNGGANTGGGGGGTYLTRNSVGSSTGGSGIVIIRLY